MARPRKENGYTAIANETLEALARTKIKAEARQVFDVVLRRTFGWNRKHAMITYRQFSEATGLRPAHVYRALKSLLERRFIEKCGKSNYAIQEDYEQWVSCTRQGQSGHGVSLLGAETTPRPGYPPASNGEDAPSCKPGKGHGSQTAKEKSKDNRKEKRDTCHDPENRHDRHGTVSFSFTKGKFENLQGSIHLLKEKFPCIDLETELRKMEAWLLAHPHRKKQNYLRFMINWLLKAKPDNRFIRLSGESFLDRCKRKEEHHDQLEGV